MLSKMHCSKVNIQGKCNTKESKNEQKKPLLLPCYHDSVLQDKMFLWAGRRLPKGVLPGSLLLAQMSLLSRVMCRPQRQQDSFYSSVKINNAK